MMEGPLKTICVTVVLALVVGLSSADGSCPTNCNCDWPRTVNCSNLGLTELPSGPFPPDTTKLDLSKNRLTRITPEVFRNLQLTNLSVLLLNNNEIHTIDPKAFHGLNDLEVLDLRYNRLEVLKRHSFSHISGQTGRCSGDDSCRLDLRNNNIQLLEADSLSWVKRLAILLGQSRTSMVVKPYAFYGMRNVPKISISSLPSVSIERGAFTNFEHLDFLEISNTLVTDVNNFTFEGLAYVKMITLSGCVIKHLEQYSFSGIHYRPEIQNFTLSKSRRHAEVGGGRFLIESSTFPSLPKDGFRDTNIARIRLRNNTIGYIQAHAFIYLDSLTVLEIINNTLPRLSTDSLASLKQMSEVTISGNSISVIEGNAFRGSEGIERLTIGHSPSVILTLEPKAFCELFDIRTFVIENLDELRILPDAFVDMSNVNDFRIFDTSLPVLRQNAFNGLRRVGALQIESCNVSRIEPGVFGLNGMSHSAGDSFDMTVGNKVLCDCDTSRVILELQSTFTKFNLECWSLSANGTLAQTPPRDIPICSSCAATQNILVILYMLFLTTVFL